MTVVDEIVVRRVGLIDYASCLAEMRDFTRRRDETASDEVWMVEHPPVYTLGQGAAVPGITNGIALVQSDRGGEITYHGPGQAVIYALVDLARRGIKVKQYVRLLEQSVIDILDGIGERKAGAPGVYVRGAKIAALGVRVVRGRAYHGVALNVDMDLSPFGAIDPCGFPGMPVTQMRDIGITTPFALISEQLAGTVIRKLQDA